MIFSTNDYPSLKAIEANWLAVREEYNNLIGNDFIAWPEKFLYDSGWDVCGLFAFGNAIEKNCLRCPITTELVTAIPGMTTAGFSLLAPGAHIRPHTGYTSDVLRYHLGISVPDNCTLRVGNEVRAWKDGESFVFDDTVEHEAHNHSSLPRAILLIDFKRKNSADIPSGVATPVSVANTVDSLTNGS